MKPMIGITAGRRSDSGSDLLNRIDISVHYSNAVVAAGGTPVILAPIPGTAGEVIDRLDGVIFSGGSDLDPVLFGDTSVHPDTYGIDPNRDQFELELAKLAYERDLPVLGICRGIQSLNVALGGTLHQHVPDVSSQQHRQQEAGVPSHDAIHEVRLEGGSIVADVFGTERVDTNSFHHQAVDKVAPTLKATGWSDDAFIEALEAPDRACFFAVQWHPEMMFAHHAEQLTPFTRLVENATARRLASTTA